MMIIVLKMDDLFKAYQIWRKYHPQYNQTRARKSFARFCYGIPLPVLFSKGSIGDWETWEVTEQQARYVEWLLGLENSPYARSLIKAQQARKETSMEAFK